MNNIFQKANCESSVNYIDFKCKISNGKINKSVQKKLIPDFTKPMLCQTKDLTFNHPDWIFENKYDGLRVIIQVEKNKCKIYTRNKISIESNYPEIKNQLEKLEVDLLLDGEIAVEDE
ncbi:MAG: hypothetical protein ACK452_00865, partial [Bacteroidota bacterium]